MAALLGHPHEQRMVFAVEAGPPRDRRLDDSSRFIVSLPAAQQTMAPEDPPRVGIDDEDRAARGIQHDGIGGLGTDAREIEKPAPERLGRLSEETAEAHPVLSLEQREETAEGPRLLPVEAGGPYE